MGLKINLWADPRNLEKFIDELEKLCRRHTGRKYRFTFKED